MTVVTIPTMYLNFLGSQVTVDVRDPLGLSLLTLGNNGVPNATACHGNRGNGTAACVEDVVDLFGYAVKLSTSSYIIAFSDVLASTIFLAFIIIFKLRLTRLVKLVDHNHVTASDYSVYCRGFPENATQQEIREHFSGLYQLKVLDWEYDGWCLKCVAHTHRASSAAVVRCFSSLLTRLLHHSHGLDCDVHSYKLKLPRNPKYYRDRGMRVPGSKDLDYKQRQFEPVRNSDNTGDEDYEGGWVAAVSVAHKNGRAINKFLKARTLLAQIRSARARLKKFGINSKFADLGACVVAPCRMCFPVANECWWWWWWGGAGACVGWDRRRGEVEAAAC